MAHLLMRGRILAQSRVFADSTLQQRMELSDHPALRPMLVPWSEAVAPPIEIGGYVTDGSCGIAQRVPKGIVNDVGELNAIRIAGDGLAAH